MSSTGPTRLELVRAIITQGRANSTGTVILHAAVAERLGLNPSDHKCADLMMSQSETCTPGRLAELTGLSTGAITGVIDRLERAGFLVREHDPEDRRRVLLRVTQTRGPEMHALFQPLSRGVEALLENYTIAELAVVLRYMREIHLVTEDIAQKLRSGAVAVGQAGAGSSAATSVARPVAATQAPARRSAGAKLKNAQQSGLSTDTAAVVPERVPLDVPSGSTNTSARETGAKQRTRPAGAREASEKAAKTRAIRKAASARGAAREPRARNK